MKLSNPIDPDWFAVFSHLNRHQQHLQTNHPDLFDDINTAPARLLGRDLKSTYNPETLSFIITILDRGISQGDESKLIRSMLPRSFSFEHVSRCNNLLIKLRTEF